MSAQIEPEDSIVWERPREQIEELEYIREGMVASSSRQKRPSLAIDGEQLGFAVLKEDAAPVKRGHFGPVFRRRVFYVKEDDPYGPPGPAEAKIPSSVETGSGSIPWGRT